MREFLLLRECCKLSEILDELGIKTALESMSSEILCVHEERLQDLVFVGVLSNGVPLAERLAKLIEARSGVNIPVGKLDVGLYRDDILKKGHFVSVRESSIPVNLTDKIVVLVDDVLFHGRTIRAALDGMMDYGRPAKIELAVLIDRGHRELPIMANYVGKIVETKVAQYVTIELYEIGAVERAVIE